MLKNEIDRLIKNYPDFPKKGIIFKDIMPLLLEPEIFIKIIDTMANQDFIKKSDALLGIDARGFLFASCLGYKLSKPVVLARKPGKLPGKLVTNSYELEYGKNSLSIQRDSLSKLTSFAIVDDLLATGGTVDCVSRILTSQDKEISGLSVVIELLELNARKRLDMAVESLVTY